MKMSWAGVFPVMTTKFTPDDSLDLRMFEISLLAQVGAGAGGVVIGAALGEASVLTSAEKEALVKFSVEKVEGQIPVLMNIAEGSTREAIRQVDLARYWGARGLMLSPPMRYKSDHRETVLFLKTIAQETDLPIAMCSNRENEQTVMTSEMLEELIECPNIQALKDGTRDLSNIQRMVNCFGDRLKILCGVDMIAMEALMIGAVGWVGCLASAFPAETVALYRSIRTGRLQEALSIYRWLLPLLELDLHSKRIQCIKLAESETGLGTEWVRAPRLILGGEERDRILNLIRQSLADRPLLKDHAPS
ncbi:MAG TPA: dihydrodipicolinate synthase family protein [Puia sp.]